MGEFFIRTYFQMVYYVASCTTCRSAMEKMRDIYSKNPQLGDAKQVAESMVATQQKIDDLAAEVAEFRVRVL